MDAAFVQFQQSDLLLFFSGASICSRFAGPWVKRAFDDSAHALKARAEALYAAEKGA